MSKQTNISPQPGEIAVASAAVSGVLGLGVWGPRALANNAPIPRAVLEIVYGGVSAYGSMIITPSVLPFLPKTSVGGKDSDGKDVMIQDNLLQVLVPPSLAGIIHAGLLYGINQEKDKWEILRNFLTGAFSQTAGYYAADVYENWNSPL
jgi:hypothetical protein